MRVLHLIDHLGPGGAQTSLVDLLEARGADIDPMVWCLSRRALPELAERLTRGGVRSEVLGLSKTNPMGLVRLRRRLADRRPQLVHAHLEYSSMLAAAVVPTGTAAPIVVHLDNDVYRRPRLARLAGRLLAPRVAGYIAVSTGVRDSAIRAYGTRVRRIAVVPPGIDVQRFDRTRIDPVMTARLRQGASRVVGTVGRLAGQKALHVLLDATPRLLADDAGTRVLIVGDGPLRAALERHARRLGIDDAVTFAGHQADVVPAYAAMDVFVLPSSYEGFGIVFVEAMASGVPVVGTRVVGSEEAVEDGVTGLLVPPGDAAALGSAVIRLTSDAALRARLQAAATSKVLRDHTRERMAASTESFYRELTQARAGGVSHV